MSSYRSCSLVFSYVMEVLYGVMKRAQNKGSEARGLTFILFFPLLSLLPVFKHLLRVYHWHIETVHRIGPAVKWGWQKKTLAITAPCGRCHHVTGIQYCGNLQREWVVLACHLITFGYLYNYMCSNFSRRLWGSKGAIVCYKVLWIVKHAWKYCSR